MSRSSCSEALALKFAAALFGEYPVRLRPFLQVFDDVEFMAALRAMRAARAVGQQESVAVGAISRSGG